MTGKQLYERWALVWAEMLTFITPWDDLGDDERNAWADLAEQVEGAGREDQTRQIVEWVRSMDSHLAPWLSNMIERKFA